MRQGGGGAVRQGIPLPERLEGVGEGGGVPGNHQPTARGGMSAKRLKQQFLLAEAAPDLLAGCREALSWMVGGAKEVELAPVMAILMQAVEKATGEEWMAPR